MTSATAWLVSSVAQAETKFASSSRRVVSGQLAEVELAHNEVRALVICASVALLVPGANAEDAVMRACVQELKVSLLLSAVRYAEQVGLMPLGMNELAVAVAADAEDADD